LLSDALNTQEFEVCNALENWLQASAARQQFAPELFNLLRQGELWNSLCRKHRLDQVTDLYYNMHLSMNLSFFPPLINFNFRIPATVLANLLAILGSWHV
jgi:hypothetical protein